MERVRYILLVVTLMVSSSGFAFDLPRDMPSFEALLSLHKSVKRDEDEALKRLTTSLGEQSSVTDWADKYNKTRTTLDSRLNNAYSYLVLVGAISSTATSLYMLIQEYSEFGGNTIKHVAKKPFVAWYFADANIAIGREIKHAQKLYATVGASGLNLMRGTMDQKLSLVMTLRATIERARGIINSASLYCYLIVNCDWKPDYIWEILNSDIKDDIAEKLVNKWNQ